MGQKITASMADNIVIGDGYVLRFNAVDPTDGSDVSGIVVTNVNVDTDVMSDGGAGGQVVGPFMLVPGPGTDVSQPESPGTNP